MFGEEGEKSEKMGLEFERGSGLRVKEEWERTNWDMRRKPAKKKEWQGNRKTDRNKPMVNSKMDRDIWLVDNTCIRTQ